MRDDYLIAISNLVNDSMIGIGEKERPLKWQRDVMDYVKSLENKLKDVTEYSLRLIEEDNKLYDSEETSSLMKEIIKTHRQALENVLNIIDEEVNNSNEQCNKDVK